MIHDMKKIIELYEIKPMPLDRNSSEYCEEYYLNNGFTHEELKDSVLTMADAVKLLDFMGVKKESAFYQFVSTFGFIPKSKHGWEVYSLEEMYADFKEPYWEDEYPNITDRFLAITSIEGEGSMFYDKMTDNIYDVTWSEMDSLLNGELKSEWSSFENYLIESAPYNKD